MATELEDRVVSKVLWRIIPFLIIAYIFNYLDRTNIGIAQLKLIQDLNFNETIFALATGIFFPGYFIFEIPSNLIMEKVGARKWMARIMISWGLVTTLMMLVNSATQFYWLRFMLGVAEAGFFPGILLYMTYWIPANYRARTIAIFMTSTAFAGLLGNPFGGLVMTHMDNVGGMHGWQWLFVVEGIPSMLLGVVALALLTDKPDEAKWLAPDEREWLSRTMEKERGTLQRSGHHSFFHSLKEPAIWGFCVAYFLLMMGFYLINFWLPQIIKPLYGPDVITVGFISAIPFLAAVIGMVIIGRHSDVTGERRLHAILSLALGGLGYLLASESISREITLLGLAIAAVGIWGTLGTFWTLCTEYLSPAAAAGGIALINSVGNLGGGYLGPKLMSKLKVTTGGFEEALAANALGLIFCALIILLLTRKRPAQSSS